MMLSFYTSSTVLAVITLILSSQWSVTKAQGGGGGAARRDKLKASVIFPTGLIGESADGAGTPGSGIKTTIKTRKRGRRNLSSTAREKPKGNADEDPKTAEIDDDKAERRRQRKEQRRNRRILNGKGGKGVSVEWYARSLLASFVGTFVIRVYGVVFALTHACPPSDLYITHVFLGLW